MSHSVPEGSVTCEGDISSWYTFSLAYYEPIRRGLQILGVAEEQVDELANEFIVKVAEKGFLDKFRAFRERESHAGRTVRFRSYLYRSLQNHVMDNHRSRARRAAVQSLDVENAESVTASPQQMLDPDAVYALDVLHQALQSLRRHCERTGKTHIWSIFHELLLADEFRGRKGKTRAQLMAEFPGESHGYLDNSLTTAKRAFRRFLQDHVPRGLREDRTPTEGFEEWMAIMSRSNSSQFNLLHVAYQVAPYLTPDMAETASYALVVEDVVPTRYEELSLVPNDDELSLLLSFRLELPFSEMLDPEELCQYFPPRSSLLGRSRWHRGGVAKASRESIDIRRPFCLLTLIEPTYDESQCLSKVDLYGMLARLKSLAKQLHHRQDHAMPDVFAQLLYTLVNVLAMVHCQRQLHSIGHETFAANIRWFLRQAWLDQRLRPLFEAAIERIASR